MEREQENNIPPAPADDAYWSSLFQQEEVIVSTLPRVEEVWRPPEERANGREAWSDHKPRERETPWQQAKKLYKSDETLELRVSGYNKGGLLVKWNGLQGFIPASQLVDFPQFHVERERLRALSEWQEKVLSLKIIEVNESTNRLIFSERAALVDATEREDLLRQIEPGEVVEGQVTNLTNFGVFVDLGGVEGLIHISELSWSRVEHPSHILEPGETVQVLVLNVDRNNERIALSRKQLRPNPWDTAEARYKSGQIVTGFVSNVASFGAFIELEEELEGLVHISELAEGNFLHPRNVVQIGERVKARVLYVDSQKKRLALSMRGLKSPPTS